MCFFIFIYVSVSKAKNCGNPGTPIHGNKDGNLYTVNREVRYSCKTGFVLNGSIRRRCLANRTWTGTLPTCTRMSSSYDNNRYYNTYDNFYYIIIIEVIFIITIFIIILPS